MQHSINELSRRTDLVQERADRAAVCLRRGDGRVINGWGVFADPSQIRTALQEAMTHIQVALNTMRDTDWPRTDSDYALLEAAHNRRAS